MEIKLEKLPENLKADFYQSYFTYTGYNFIDINGFKIPIFKGDFQKFSFSFDCDKKKHVFTLKKENENEQTTIDGRFVFNKRYFRAVVMTPTDKLNQYKVQRKTTLYSLFGGRKNNIESYVILGKREGKNKGYYVCEKIIDIKNNQTEEFFLFETMENAVKYVQSKKEKIYKNAKHKNTKFSAKPYKL